jgi:putative ABC transport system permease protein
LLVKVLTGVFDPPPAHLAVPSLYLAAVTIGAVMAAAVAAELTIRASRRPVIETIREL